MTHKDIYTKFMIEYDKANVTSSYPSLTEFEVATLLDKAYDLIVDRKFTGMNNRKAYFEADIKTIQDLQPLIKHRLAFIGSDGDQTKEYNNFPKDETNTQLPLHQFEREPGDDELYVPIKSLRSMPDNLRSVEMPSDMLYFVAAAVPQDIHDSAGWLNDDRATTNKDDQFVPMDSKLSDRNDGDGQVKWIRYVPAKLVSHEIAEKFYATTYNIPWVKNPLCYIEDDRIYIVVDPIVGIPSLQYTDPDSNTVKSGEWTSLTYLRKHNRFVKDIAGINQALSTMGSAYNEQVEVDEGAYLPFSLDRYNLKKDDVTDTLYLTNKQNIRVKFQEDTPFINGRDREDDEYWKIMYMRTPLSFDETNISALEMYNNLPTQIGQGQYEYHTYLGYEVGSISADSSKSIDPGEKLIVIGYIESNNPQVLGQLLTKITKVFTLTYDNLKALVNTRPLINGKIAYVASNNVSQDSYSNPRYANLPSGSFYILPYTLSAYCKFDSASNNNRVTTCYTLDSIVDYSKIAKNINPKMFYVDINSPYEKLADAPIAQLNNQSLNNLYTFELSDSVANELVTTAITFALENVESTRLQSHSSLMTLEP